jgi:hypothetical protein
LNVDGSYNTTQRTLISTTHPVNVNAIHRPTSPSIDWFASNEHDLLNFDVPAWLLVGFLEERGRLSSALALASFTVRTPTTNFANTGHLRAEYQSTANGSRGNTTV